MREAGSSTSSPTYARRLAAYSSVSTSLALHSDRELAALIDAAPPLNSGIGGTAALLDVGGTRVFVKRVPLTELELRPENLRSTANLFELPLYCHYGIAGGPGWGAWRELAVQVMTTNWVLAREYEGFPLMYHWRVLPHPGQELPEEIADVDKVVEFWGGAAGVRNRLEAMRDAPASLALFLEYFPHDLHNWFGEEVKAGDEAVTRACAMVARELEAGTSFMNARGLLHFDAHFQNLLTDGRHLYFSDYGLAISSHFDLDAQEAEFFAANEVYDRAYSLTHLTIWLVTALYDYWGEERAAFLRACAAGTPPTGIPPLAAELIMRHAPTAVLMTDFYRTMARESRLTPFPLEAVTAALEG